MPAWPLPTALFDNPLNQFQDHKMGIAGITQKFSFKWNRSFELCCYKIFSKNSKYLHLNQSGLGIVWVMTSLAVNQIFSRQANPRPPWAGNTLIPQFGLVSSRTFIIYMSWLIENFYHLHVTKFKLLEFILHPNKPIPLWGQFCLDAHNY